MVDIDVIVSVVTTTVVVGITVVNKVKVCTLRKLVQNESALLALRRSTAIATSIALQKSGVRSSSAIGLAAERDASAKRARISKKYMVQESVM